LKEVVRTILIEPHPTEQQKDLLYRMFRSSAEIYNTLIDFLQYKRKACQELQKQGIEKPWKSDPDLDICRKGWATELIRALIPRKACEYPKREVEIRIKSGRQKGEYRLEPATVKNSKPDYGVSGQTQGLICQAFEASIKACVSKWKKGDYSAELPRRKKGLHCLYFSSQEIKRDGNKLKLGSGKYCLVFKLDELAGIDIKGDARIYRTRGGKIMLSLTRKIPVEPNPELTEVAAIDFGQKRAMVIATADGATAAISGKDICALKRERDRRYREINRLRSRMLRGQIRQYLTAEEKEKMRSLQLRDNERQRQGKKRTGEDIKYALRIIRQRRKEERQREIEEQGLENVLKRFLGRELSENDKQNLDRLKEQYLARRSRRERAIARVQNRASDYYRIRLRYANHAITRAAARYCEEHKIGKVYVGDLSSLPKRRKSGSRRIKQVHRNNLWEMPTQARYLDEKLKLVGGTGTQEASEAFSSQVCPNCGRRHKPRNRVYFCNPEKGGCGYRGDRDSVGACNFLSAVVTGACGNIKPAQNRTLRIAPAIRQGLRVCTPLPSQSLTGQSEPAEESAKGHKSADLQESAIVADSCAPRTDRKPLDQGKTQVRAGVEVLADAGTPTPTGDGETCSPATTVKSGAKRQSGRRCLQDPPEPAVQLTIWDTG
jgi:hypothetical protein